MAKKEKRSRALGTVPAGFVELNPNPVLTLDMGRQVIYANATARARFPGLTSLATRHPVFAGWDSLWNQLTNDVGELVVFVREVSHAGIVYEQQILALPGEGAVCVFMTDITARKQAEEQLRENAATLVQANVTLKAINSKLLSQNVELDEFAHVTSHDLQEPLRKLLSFSGALRQDLGCELPPRADQDLDFISDAARRMHTLINDLLMLSRAGRSALRREPVDLTSCLDDAIYSLSVKIEETRGRITHDELPRIVGDATLLTQLFQNLIGNALKFVRPGCRPEIHVSAEYADGEWIIGVRDNGIGIKAEYQQQIFAPFKRLHGDGEYEGSGIGLSICRKAVERHGGAIWVESQPGRGSHFKFRLSAQEQAGQCASAFDEHFTSQRAPVRSSID